MWRPRQSRRRKKMRIDIADPSPEQPMFPDETQNLLV